MVSHYFLFKIGNTIYCIVDTGNIGTSLIKQRLRMYKKQLLDELEPAAIVYELRKADASLKVKLDSVGGARSCGERIYRLLTIVEEGSPDLVKEFMHTLNVLGYTEIVNLIDPKGVHNKSSEFILNIVCCFI